MWKSAYYLFSRGFFGFSNKRGFVTHHKKICFKRIIDDSVLNFSSFLFHTRNQIKEMFALKRTNVHKSVRHIPKRIKEKLLSQYENKKGRKSL